MYTDDEKKGYSCRNRRKIAVIPLSLSKLISFTLSSKDSISHSNIQRRSRITHRVRKNKTVACHPVLSPRRLTRSIETPQRRMRIITIITANNNGLVGRSRSSCSDGRRSAEPRYEPPAHYLEGPRNERVSPHHGASLRACCRSTRRRRSGPPVLVPPVGCEPVSRPDWVVSQSHRLAIPPSILSGTNFGGDVPATCFGKTGIREITFDD